LGCKDVWFLTQQRSVLKLQHSFSFLSYEYSPSFCAAFQQLEVDYCAAKPDAKFASDSQRTLQEVPVLRMYGVTEAGNSVCAFLHGFEPYFFCKCTDSRCVLSPDDLPIFKEALNVRCTSLPYLNMQHRWALSVSTVMTWQN
jgi:hypothetical protein